MGNNKKLTYEEVYDRFKEKGYELLEKEYICNSHRMECIDLDGYKYSICNNLLQNGRTSDKFGVLNPYTIHNINNYLRINSNGSKFVGDIYEGSKSIVKITCESCGEEIEMTWANIFRTTDFSCKKCRINPMKYTMDFIKEEFKKSGLEILDEEYIGNNEALTCIDKDGYKVKKKYSSLCMGKESYIFSNVFNKENYIYNINNYFKINNINCMANKIIEESNDAVWIDCICECKRNFKTNINAIRDGQVRCTYCSKTMSKLEYKVRLWLDDNNIEYIFQHKFKDCKNIRPLPFDFYLPKYNCCIEVDGQQHFFPSKFSNTDNVYKDFERRKKHDAIKTNYCKINNIKLLRISFNDIRRRNNNYIKILSKEFGQN